ncbi:MAG: hypothetical protein AB1481_02515 [Candidatus Omnitrophota bacterium]
MKRHLIVLLIFLATLTVITYPLVFKINTHIPGFFSTDEPYTFLWDSWRIKYSFLKGLSVSHTPLIAAPFGLSVGEAAYCPFLWHSYYFLLSMLTSNVFTYNFQVLLNMLLSAFIAYLFVSYLTKNRLCGVLAGMIFAFSPLQFARMWQHLGLTYMEWIPLVLFLLILFKEKGTKKHLISFFLGYAFLLSFDYQISYFTTLAIFVFLLYSLVYGFRSKEKETFSRELKFARKATGAVLLAFVVFSFQFLPFLFTLFNSQQLPSVFNPYRRSFEDLFMQSAKPLSYFLPSPMHPVFGKFTERLVGSSLYGMSFTEHVLYLGWVGIILAFIAIRSTKGKNEHGEGFYIRFFLLLALVSWLFSQPPWWKMGPVKIYMPSFFMYKIIPMYRAYCRFGIMVMFSVAVLAAFGFKYIIEKYKNKKARVGLAMIFCGLVLFEFWNYPPLRVIDVSVAPEVYSWINSRAGDFAIAEYPLDVNSPNEFYKFYQTKHGKKMIDGTVPGTSINEISRSLVNLSELDTAKALRWMEVRYALVHRDDYLNTDLVEQIEELDKIPRNTGLKFIRSFLAQRCRQEEIHCTIEAGPIDVYEIIAEPAEPMLEDKER